MSLSQDIFYFSLKTLGGYFSLSETRLFILEDEIKNDFGFWDWLHNVNYRYVGKEPFGVAVTPDGKKVYVASEGTNSVFLIDTATNEVTATVKVGRLPVAFGQFIGGKQDTLVAAFSACPESGKTPLAVKFTDESAGSPTSWLWDFGDCSTSTVKDPVHNYCKAGRYTVSLTVENATGNNSVTKFKYITVKNK
jgi:YVTN family beta-propeller protein